MLAAENPFLPQARQPARDTFGDLQAQLLSFEDLLMR